MKVFDYRYGYIYLPNLQSFKTGNESFFETTSLSLSGNSIQFYFSLYLPNLQSFEIGKESFYETTSLYLSSNSIQFFFYSYLPNLQSLEIGENCLNKWKDDMVIENYPNLQSIVVKKNSLQNLNSLKICNCEIMKYFEIGDCAFYNVKNVIIESI